MADMDNWRKLCKEHSDMTPIVEKYKEYICSETLATLNMVDNIGENIEELELIDNISVKIKISKN